jgi:hypothetical protein
MTHNNDDGYVTIDGRRYPKGYPPGCHWAIDEAWRVLDTVRDGAIPDTIRCFLAGAIAGALIKNSRK